MNQTETIDLSKVPGATPEELAYWEPLLRKGAEAGKRIQLIDTTKIEIASMKSKAELRLKESVEKLPDEILKWAMGRHRKFLIAARQKIAALDSLIKDCSAAGEVLGKENFRVGNHFGRGERIKKLIAERISAFEAKAEKK